MNPVSDRLSGHDRPYVDISPPKKGIRYEDISEYAGEQLLATARHIVKNDLDRFPLIPIKKECSICHSHRRLYWFTAAIAPDRNTYLVCRYCIKHCRRAIREARKEEGGGYYGVSGGHIYYEGVGENDERGH